ncbi:hypothetical protein B566_EDAN004751 [Ephemera danica]|nr:hypothetical protein B566_EDAN004751 [Ephemera danica]
MAFGEYPAEYNPRVHGPYDPARYYGKADTPFSQLKVAEIGGWLGRRNKSPKAVAGAVSRAWWRWQHKYVQPKRTGIAPFFHVVFGAMTFFYVINYGKLSKYQFSSPHSLYSNLFSTTVTTNTIGEENKYETFTNKDWQLACPL